MSFWDEFKKMFETNQQREENKANSIEDAIKNEKTIVDQLAKLDEEYKSSLPKDEEIDLEKLFPVSLGLSKIDYTGKSDDELKQQAETELLANLSSEKNSVLEKIKKEKDSVNSSKEESAQDAEDSLAKLDALYKSLKDKAEKSAIKRGLGRSSIIMSELSDYDKNQANSATSVQTELMNNINLANQKLTDLEAEKDTALGELDLKYASEVSKKIDSLQKERDEAVLKYKKYNDSVAEQEAKYSAERAKEVQSYLSELENTKSEEEKAQIEKEKVYGYTGDKQKNYAQRYEIALEFYNSLSPDIASDALEASPNMRFYLGNYYNKLKEILDAKGSSTDRYF